MTPPEDDPPYFPWNDPMALLETIRIITLDAAKGKALNTGDLKDTAQSTFLHLFEANNGNWKNRPYFFAAVGKAIRQLIGEFRHKRHRRGFEVPLDEAAEVAYVQTLSATSGAAIRQALVDIEKPHPLWAEVLGYHYFGGLTRQSIATIMKIDPSTVKRYEKNGKQALAEIFGILPKPPPEDPDSET